MERSTVHIVVMAIRKAADEIKADFGAKSVSHN